VLCVALLLVIQALSFNVLGNLRMVSRFDNRSFDKLGAEMDADMGAGHQNGEGRK
jgi:hypothetical protein